MCHRCLNPLYNVYGPRYSLLLYSPFGFLVMSFVLKPFWLFQSNFNLILVAFLLEVFSHWGVSSSDDIGTYYFRICMCHLEVSLQMTYVYLLAPIRLASIVVSYLWWTLGSTIFSDFLFVFVISLLGPIWLASLADIHGETLSSCHVCCVHLCGTCTRILLGTLVPWFLFIYLYPYIVQSSVVL